MKVKKKEKPSVMSTNTHSLNNLPPMADFTIQATFNQEMSNEDNDHIDHALNNKNDEIEILVVYNNDHIMMKTICSLRPYQWLYDEVLTMFFNYK